MFDFTIHPAKTIPFNQLYDGILKEVELGNVNRVIHPTLPLELFDYTRELQFGKVDWTIYSLVSRGLILCPQEHRIVALTFPKFFNFSQPATCDGENLNQNISDLITSGHKFVVKTKVDGSMGTIFNFHNHWYVSTRGSFKSEQALWAMRWLTDNNVTPNLDPNITYLAEIIYKDNRIVIPYDFEGLVLLTGYDLTTGQEITNPEHYVNFRHVEKHTFNSIDDMVNLCTTLPFNQEGFVVRFDNGYRCKIKGTEYVRLHRLICNVTPTHIWECMLNGDDLEAIKIQLPEEIMDDFNSIVSIFNKKLDDIIAVLKEAHDQTKLLSDKELGLAIKTGTLGLSDIIKSMLFCCRKHDLLEAVKIKGSDMRKKVFKSFYPKANYLPEYSSSTLVNRFCNNP